MTSVLAASMREAVDQPLCLDTQWKDDGLLSSTKLLNKTAILLRQKESQDFIEDVEHRQPQYN